MPINAVPCPNCGARCFPEDKNCPSCGVNLEQLPPELTQQVSTHSSSTPLFVKVLRAFGVINLVVGLLIGLIILLAVGNSNSSGLILLVSFAVISECLIVFALFYALASMSENLIAIRKIMETDKYKK
jgi:hypothetical protein